MRILTVLIILDRNMDLGTMLHHTWSYQCLAHDVFDMKSNRISFASTNAQGATVNKTYDIDIKDFIWARNASASFPETAADVDKEWTTYRKEADDISRKFGVDNVENIQTSDPASSSLHLKEAIKCLPELTERKRIIEMHMN
eukprot:Partr_v1_DN27088_c0_g1_i2_m29210 putative sec1 family